jgi:hypothetical protein
MRRSLGLLVMMLLVLGGGRGVASTDENWSFGLTYELFRELGVDEHDCPDSVASTLRKDRVAECATLELDFKRFEQRLEKALKRLDSHDVQPAGRWSKANDDWRKRFYLHSGMFPWWVAFNETNGGLIVVTGGVPRDCPGWEEPLASGADVDKRAKLIRSTHVEPEWPGGIEKNAAEVVLGVRIGTDGVPEVLCLVHANPEGQGFEDAAVAAVQRWRYKPAQHDGEAVQSMMTVHVTWNIR